MLGMYVHMHWGYGHPYCARTWTREDWRQYLGALKLLGYDTVMIWPMTETMPDPLTPSDEAFLVKMADVIRMAREDLGFRVVITFCPNLVGNDHAAEYTFEDRAYFRCEQKVNPRDEGEVARFKALRAKVCEYLGKADALAIIDSDPGGYIGTTNADFVNLVQWQVKLFREHNPQAEFIYWMHMGWENYNRFWEDAKADPTRMPDLRFDLGVYRETLALMREQIPEPWGVYAGMENHFKATEFFGMQAKRILFPYGVIEGEPTFPLANCDLERMAGMLKHLPYHPDHRGRMGNAQNHCLQLPHTFAFAEMAKGVSADMVDLLDFARRLIPACAPMIHAAWLLMETGQADKQAELATELQSFASHEAIETGDCAGLLFGDPHRFLWDLAMNLEIRAGLNRFEQAVAAGEQKDPVPALMALLVSLDTYEKRVQFHDAYMGELEIRLNNNLAKLGDPALTEITQKFQNWQTPEIRHGLARELFLAAGAYCTRSLVKS